MIDLFWHVVNGGENDRALDLSASQWFGNHRNVNERYQHSFHHLSVVLSEKLLVLFDELTSGSIVG